MTNTSNSFQFFTKKESYIYYYYFSHGLVYIHTVKTPIKSKMFVYSAVCQNAKHVWLHKQITTKGETKSLI